MSVQGIPRPYIPWFIRTRLPVSKAMQLVGWWLCRYWNPHTYTLRHWQSLQETSPVVSCSGSCTRSHRQWQNQPGSEQAGLHPKEHLSPTYKGKETMQMRATWLRALTTLFKNLLLRTTKDTSEGTVQKVSWHKKQISLHIRHKHKRLSNVKITDLTFSLSSFRQH